MSYFCSECVVNWWPYQACGGCCPRCGSGTTLRQEPASDDAEPQFVLARVEAAHRERCVAFEAYYAQRELDRGGDARPHPLAARAAPTPAAGR